MSQLVDKEIAKDFCKYANKYGNVKQLIVQLAAAYKRNPNERALNNAAIEYVSYLIKDYVRTFEHALLRDHLIKNNMVSPSNKLSFSFELISCMADNIKKDVRNRANSPNR